MAEYSIRREGEDTEVALIGRLAGADITALRPALNREIGTGSKAIRFDLSGIEALDSAGIGLLLAAGNSLDAVHGSVTVLNAPQDIVNLLAAMGLTERLHIAPAGKESVDGGE